MPATITMTKRPSRRTTPGRAPSAAKSGTRVEIALAKSCARRVNLIWIRRHLDRALPLLNRAIARVAVEILDDAAMKNLHREHLGINATTDVLTFPAVARGPINVDIAVCADEAARRAAALGHPIERELLLYIVHGLLHCAGFDDRDAAAARAMHAEEDRILEAIGAGTTFARRSHRQRAGRGR